MNNEPGRIQVVELIRDIRSYVEKRLEIFELEAKDKASRLIAAIISDGLGLLLMSVAGLFFLIAAGFGLGMLLDNNSLGFAIVASALFLPGIYFYKFKRNILKKKIQAKVIDFAERNIESGSRKKETQNSSDNE